MDNGSAFGEGSWIFGLIVLLGLFGGFGGGFGGNNATMAGYATMADVINNQSTMQALGSIQLSSANNDLETARQISDQNMAMMQQNNTNLINAIQGFNQVNQNIASGFASVNQNMAMGFSSVNQNISDLGYRLDKCCCDIKTQMLENRLQDAQTELLSSRNANAIFAQNQYLLSQLGTYTPAAVV